MSSQPNKPATPTATPAATAKPAVKLPAKTVAKQAARPAAKAAPVAAQAPRPAAATPAAPKPAVSKPAEAKPVAAKPAAIKPAETKPASVKAAAVAKPVRPAASAKPVRAAAKPVPAPAPSLQDEPAAFARAAAAQTPLKAVPLPELPEPIAKSLEGAAAAVGQVLPKAINDLTSSGLSQARENYATLRENAQALTAGIESGSHAAARGLQDFSKTFLEALQANTDATLGFLRAMTGVRSISEAIEMQSRHTRSQFETVTSQAKTLAGIAQRTAAETADPVRKALDRSMRRGA